MLRQKLPQLALQLDDALVDVQQTKTLTRKHKTQTLMRRTTLSLISRSSCDVKALIS
jgi:hypothetical protein